MKTLKRTQMQSFQGDTLKDLEREFNRTMEWVSKAADNYKEPVVDIATLRGYVIFEELVRVPENIRDQLDLAGERVTCGQCRKFERERYNNGTCEFCRGLLRTSDEACDKLFKAWQEGDCWLAGREGERLNDLIDKSGHPVLRCSAER